MDDLEFVRRCSEGDKQSWDQFVEKYSRLIYSYIHSVLKLKGVSPSKENTDDIFQDIFVLLTKDNFRKLKTFQGKNGCSLASWLRQVTVNFTIDYVRRLKPVISIDEEDENNLAFKDIIVDKAPLASDTFTREEKLGHLKDCIGRLDREDKYFLELHLNQGLSLEGLRGHLRISRPAIDMRKSRIIDKLRDCFKGKGFQLDL